MGRALIALLALAGLLAVSAQASPPQAAAGDFAVTALEFQGARPAGPNCVIDLRATFSFAGSLDGSFDAGFRIVRFGPCDVPVAPDRFHAAGTFTGSVAGLGSGSFDFVLVGGVDDTGAAHARLVVLQGAGGLAGLHGTLELDGVAGVDGSYAGSLHVDP